MLNLPTIALIATIAAGGAAASVAPTASAKGKPGAVTAAGTCTKNTHAKLKLSRDDSRVEVEFEVDQNRSGIPWKVTLRRNGSLVASTTATTHAPSGSFTVRRLIAGAKGSFAAVATRSGERCTARASI